MSKVWLITGCSTGFGRELANEVLKNGDQVIVTARNVDDVSDIVATYPELATAFPLNVTLPEEIESCVNKTVSLYGRIDVLVNNAGIGYFGAIEESQEEDIRKMFEINFFGLDNLTRQVLPTMRRQKSGFILNFSSIGGLMSFPSLGFYNATKFAVEGYSEALSKEIAPLGIKVVLIEPGPFRTDWAGRSAKEANRTISDYQDTADVQANLRGGSGKELGDPIRAAKAIVKVVDAENPPLRLLLGSVALKGAYQKLNELRSDFDNWEGLTLSADFPAEESNN